MTLRELLQVLRRDMLRDTSDRVSGDSDQLWSDTTLVAYIDRAQRRFARRSLCIRDATSPVSQFVTIPLQQDYVLDPSVVAVKSIRCLGNGTWVPLVPPPVTGPQVQYVTDPVGLVPVYPDRLDLARTSHPQRRGQGYYDTRDAEWAWDVNNLGTRYYGRPLTWESDETVAEVNGSSGVVTVRLYPVPDQAHAACLMQMRVARLPVTRLTPSNLSTVPEIPDDYHLDMLDYAAYLALRIVDHEAGDAERAGEFQQSFDRHVEEARTEIDRKGFQPMSWGYGSRGFVYTGN